MNTRTENPAVDARRLQPCAAELAGAIRVGERHDDQVADFHGADVRADGVHDADGLVAHGTAGVAGRQRRGV